MYFIFAFLAGKIFSCNLHGEDIITDITFWIYHTNLSKDQGMARVSIGVWQDILSESLFWTTHMNLSKVFSKENLTLLFSFLLFLGTRFFTYLKNGVDSLAWSLHVKFLLQFTWIGYYNLIHLLNLKCGIYLYSGNTHRQTHWIYRDECNYRLENVYRCNVLVNN